MPDSLMFVQFPHPGPEHQPKGLWMEWNRRRHARKFLKATGTYISDGKTRTGPFVFWGEWEPQSKIIDSYPQLGPGLPHWLHEPHWQVPEHRRLLQNTDPLVFGDRFLYSNCRQGGNRKLRELAPGSLVLFGSSLGGEFVLDTVFVVGDNAEHFTGASADSVLCEEWVSAVVFDPLSLSSKAKRDEFRLYRGISYEDAPSGPFSFVPCRPLGADGSAFTRPRIRLDNRRVNPKLSMGAKATPATVRQLKAVWDDVVTQVDEAGLSLGLQLDAPPQRT